MSKGFTLIEILIVIIIVGILTSLAVPVYQAQLSRAYQQEALTHLGALRRALAFHYSVYETYNGANIGSPCNLKYCPNDPDAAGQVPHYFYILEILDGGSNYRVTAVSNYQVGFEWEEHFVSMRADGTITIISD